MDRYVMASDETKAPGYSIKGSEILDNYVLWKTQAKKHNT